MAIPRWFIPAHGLPPELREPAVPCLPEAGAGANGLESTPGSTY
jgi:hypothetical protein